MTNKLLGYINQNAIQVIILVLVLVIAFGGSSKSLGGTTNYDAIDVSDGYSVDGTSIIDGSGNFSIAGTLTASAGDVRLINPVRTGSVYNMASSSVATLTAAQVCDNSLITHGDWAGIASSTAQINLPTAANMYADCLTTNGDELKLYYSNTNLTAGSLTAILANTSTTLVGIDANADTIAGSNEAVLRFVRASNAEMKVFIDEYTGAD